MSTTEAARLASPDKKVIREFFDEISPRYDFINDVLSLRLDARWRAQALKIILDGTESRVLDLGTGTGKFLELFLKRQRWKFAVGLDFSARMLERAKERLRKNVVIPAKTGINFVSGDFHALPFQNESFDLAVSSFALRSVKDMQEFCSEVHRVLEPGGKAAFLCLTRPHHRFFRALYYPYLHFYMPTVGRCLSGHREAYEFLAQSIQHFQEPTKTVEWLKRVGFESVRLHDFMFGAATLFFARKKK